MDDEWPGDGYDDHSDEDRDQFDDSQDITDESAENEHYTGAENDARETSPVNSIEELIDQGPDDNLQAAAELPDGAHGGGDVIGHGDEQGLLRPEYLCQHGYPHIHDRVAFFDEDYGWTDVTLTSKRLKRYGVYYNYLDDDGFEAGVYLDPDKRWTFIEDSCCDICTGVEAQAPIAQVDGVYIPNSLTPTPETTPEKEEHIRFDLGEYIKSSSSDDGSIVATLDRSFTGSPEWDSYGTNLESPLSRPHHGLCEPVQHVTGLDRAVDLSLVLPLTSTTDPHL